MISRKIPLLALFFTLVSCRTLPAPPPPVQTAAPVAVATPDTDDALSDQVDGKIVRFGLKYSGKRIDIDGAAVPKAGLVQEVGESDKMLFRIQPAGKDSHTVEHVQSGLCMALKASSASSRLTIEPCAPFLKAQQFSFTENSDGTYQIMSDLTDMCLDIKDISRSAGAKVIQWECTGSKNQRVTIEIVDANPKNASPRDTALAPFLDQDLYMQVQHSGAWIGLYEDKTVRRTPVAQMLDSKRRQVFRIQDEGSGQYSLRHPASGLCIAIGRESLNIFGAAQLEPCSRPSARFVFFKRDGDTFQIKNVHSAHCLDIEAASKFDSARLTQWFCNNAGNQKFRLELANQTGKRN